MSNVLWGFPSPGQTVIEEGYSYKEVPISSAEIINPGVTPVGTGKELLPALPGNQYYEAKVFLEFYPGSVGYNGGAGINLIYSVFNITFQIGVPILTNTACIVQQATFGIYDLSAIYLGDAMYLYWGTGWTDGNGTMKVKIWYKVINFG